MEEDEKIRLRSRVVIAFEVSAPNGEWSLLSVLERPARLFKEVGCTQYYDEHCQSMLRVSRFAPVARLVGQFYLAPGHKA